MEGESSGLKKAKCRGPTSRGGLETAEGQQHPQENLSGTTGSLKTDRTLLMLRDECGKVLVSGHEAGLGRAVGALAAGAALGRMHASQALGVGDSLTSWPIRSKLSRKYFTDSPCHGEKKSHDSVWTEDPEVVNGRTQSGGVRAVLPAYKQEGQVKRLMGVCVFQNKKEIKSFLKMQFL